MNRVLAALLGDTPAQIRDRALVLLQAVYGLRAGEAVALRLDDFDWQRVVLTVPRGKGHKPRTYPLCRPVGDAVLRYLREVRPASAWREVFLTLRPPFRPLPRGSVTAAVGRRLWAVAACSFFPSARRALQWEKHMSHWSWQSAHALAHFAK